MKYIIEGIEPQFKVYKTSETIKGMFYIGKTKRSLKERMNNHKSCQSYSSKYFADVGWDNVIVEIIDVANDEKELSIKEVYHIIKNLKENKDNILNRQQICTYEAHMKPYQIVIIL